MIAENPRITKLKDYKGFTTTKVETFSNWGKIVTYEAWREVCGETEDYVCENSLAGCKHEIDFILLTVK